MQVSQVIRRFSLDNWGGTESVVLHTARQLNKLGVRSEILATQALDNVAQSKKEGITVRRFPYAYPYLGLSQQNKLALDRKGGNPFSRKLVQHLKETSPDLIHAHSMQRMAGMVKQAASALKVPYIVSFHGGYCHVPQEEITQMTTPVRRRFHYGRLIDPCFGYHQPLSHATGLVCVNPEEAEKMKQKYPSKKVIYMPNGVYVNTPQIQQASAERFRQTYHIPEHMPLVLCVGRIDAQKGQMALIKALREAQQPFGVVLIGPVTDTEYAQSIQAEVTQHGLQNRVWILPGFTPEHQTLADACAAATVVALPSRHEPFGIVALEAWRQRKPVVAHGVGGLNTLIEQGHNGLKSSPETFNETLYNLLKNSALQKKLGEAGYQTVCQNYAWEALTQDLKKFYESCIYHYQKSSKELRYA